MEDKSDVFKKALVGKKIPVLTLDNNWHRLFTQVETTKEITELENELNELLKKQGRLNSDSRDIKNLKKRLMTEIVENMDELDKGSGKKSEKKLEENKRLIEECNQKIKECENGLLDMPKLIDEVNYRLMLATMESCYEQIFENNAEIDEITEWVNSIRAELKKKLVIKQQKIKRNQNFYTYMHNIFGSDVIDIFDMKYNIEPLKTESNTDSPKELKLNS